MPIANFLIPKILNKFRKEDKDNEFDEDDMDDILYSLRTILWEIEKTIYLIIIFALLGSGLEIIAAMLSVITIRPSAGGFHSSTVWGCFWWTFLGFLLALFVLPLIPLTAMTVIFVAVFSIPITFIASPLRGKIAESMAHTIENREMKDKRKKIKVTLITVVWFAVLFFNRGHVLSPPVLWIIFLQNVQLGIEYLKRQSEKRALRVH